MGPAWRCSRHLGRGEGTPGVTPRCSLAEAGPAGFHETRVEFGRAWQDVGGPGHQARACGSQKRDHGPGSQGWWHTGQQGGAGTQGPREHWEGSSRPADVRTAMSPTLPSRGPTGAAVFPAPTVPSRRAQLCHGAAPAPGLPRKNTHPCCPHDPRAWAPHSSCTRAPCRSVAQQGSSVNSH